MARYSKGYSDRRHGIYGEIVITLSNQVSNILVTSVTVSDLNSGLINT